MTDTALASGTAAIAASAENDPRDPIADSIYAEAALEAHKREGLTLAVRARWIAMPLIGIFLIWVNPSWDVLYYHFILALICLNGWFISRAGRVGQSRLELLLIFADLFIMTFGMVVPNPFSPHDLPVAMQYRFDNFIYFFVILAAGTLAYSWRTVIAIGSWTAAMWMIALGLAWWFSTPDPELAAAAAGAFAGHWELSEFFDPNNFLFHMRVQEVIVFVLVSVTLGYSARRFNGLLLNNAGLERERANLSRYFSPNVVEQLSQNDEPLKQVRSENVAVMFIDIVGFTRLTAGSDPREVIELLRGFHGRMEREVFRHGGTLDKYLGDGLMATFGTPVSGDADAANALQCARDMCASLTRWNTERRRAGEPELRIGIGLHYGEVVLGDIGANRLEYAVIGSAVNIASRLESLTRTLNAGIAMSAQMHRQVQAECPGSSVLEGLECRPGQQLKGLDAPMDVWVCK
jgi:adenylate cyclase